MMFGLPIGWRKKKLQKRVAGWRPVKSEPPPKDACLLFAKEWSDCGWLLDTGWVDQKTGQCVYKPLGNKQPEFFEPDYWMFADELTSPLEKANYGDNSHDQ